MRVAFGEIGDLRLHVITATAQADELHETKGGNFTLEEEVAALNSVNTSRDERLERIEARLAEGIQMAAERIEGLARSLNGAGQGYAPWRHPRRPLGIREGDHAGAAPFFFHFPRFRFAQPGMTTT